MVSKKRTVLTLEESNIMKIIKVEATPQPSPFQKCFLPRNDLAESVLHMLRRPYLDEGDMYVLQKLGLKIEVTKK